MIKYMSFQFFEIPWKILSKLLESLYNNVFSDEYKIYFNAESYANKGYVVVAVIKNPDPHKPGHTALVTPATITDSLLAESGPRLIMAGKENSNYISLKAGFKRHLTTWPEHDIEFYYFKDRVF